ncbi:hypothetical protein HYC85_009028 [Camellia sinensis]|uniref:PB1 domain-containing protein n=1 Tax=Camellia sinensis TaxID=4442 RepID=A0A7J7HTL2_CAMSI|nr:hypothetical protein HYC85_009028 [Camellia sinensis]
MYRVLFKCEEETMSCMQAGNLYQKLINCEDNPGELHREIEKLEGEVLGLRSAIERHQKDVEELNEEELDRSTLECVRPQERNIGIGQRACYIETYEDGDHDNVVLALDSDLVAAVDHARLAGWKVLKLHLDHSGTQGHRRGSQSGGVEYAQSDVWASAYSALAAGAALIAGLSMLAYLGRNAATFGTQKMKMLVVAVTSMT